MCNERNFCNCFLGETTQEMIETALDKELDVVDHILAEMKNDDENESQKLLEAYKGATAEERSVMDYMLSCLCGETMSSVIEKMLSVKDDFISKVETFLKTSDAIEHEIAKKILDDPMLLKKTAELVEDELSDKGDYTSFVLNLVITAAVEIVLKIHYESTNTEECNDIFSGVVNYLQASTDIDPKYVEKILSTPKLLKETAELAEDILSDIEIHSEDKLGVAIASAVDTTIDEISKEE